MARINGFRIYVFKAYPNRPKGNDPLDVSASSWARTEIFEILEALAARGTKFIQAAPSADPAEPARPARSITVRPPQPVRGDLIHLEVAIGETGSHGEATREGKTPKKLRKWSPEATHYVTFLFPEQAADQFIVVTQAIRRRDPIVRLTALIREESKSRRDARKEQDRVEREEAKARGERPSKLKTRYRLAFKYVQAADNRYLSEILGSAKRASAVFTSTAPSSRGSRSGQVERTLTVRLLDQKGRDIGREVGRDWMLRRRRGDEVSQAQGVSELAALMEDDDLLTDGEAARYEKAAVTVSNSEGDSTTIAVDTLRDVFTYPVSDGAPGILYYYERVAGRVKIVAQEERINVAEIDPGEVEECLAG